MKLNPPARKEELVTRISARRKPNYEVTRKYPRRNLIHQMYTKALSLQKISFVNYPAQQSAISLANWIRRQININQQYAYIFNS